MHRILRVSVLIIVSVVLAGCARSPQGAIITIPREMSFRIDFDGPINDNYYYFVAIDTSGGGEGPIPIFPGAVTGEGWVTGSANYYVQYHQRQYSICRITNLQPFQYEPVGAPIRSTLPEFGGTTLAFTIDLDTIGAAGESVDINIITVDQPFSDIRFLDGLGTYGAQFLPEVDITTDRTITNSESLNPEGRGDILDQDRIIQPVTEETQPLDIINWSITTDV